MFKKTITTDFFTSVSFSQFIESLSAISIKIFSLKNWENNEILKQEFLSYIWMEKSKAISLYDWRSAIFQSLKMVWIKKGDEIIINWYTCISVVNAVIQSWANIKYCDTSKRNFWLDIKSLESNLTKKTKAIIIQHSFWKSADIAKIVKLAKEKNILIIEDCCHSLGTKINKKHLWTFWDFSIFSFGRDKVISCVNWWLLIINNKQYFEKIIHIEKKLINPSNTMVLKNHYYNILWFLSYKSYDFLNFWKILITLSKKVKFIPEIISEKEKILNYDNFYYKLPNSLAWLAISELWKLKEYNNHRRNVADFYDKEIKNENIKIWFKKLKSEKNNYFRYPILFKDTKNKQDFINYMKQNWIYIWSTWSGSNIVPKPTKWIKTWYIKWTCNNAENISSRFLTLPNHKNLNTGDLIKIINLINNFKVKW